MTERLAETTRRIESMHQLETVVTAMRGISASRAQQARVMLHGLRAHASVIAGAIGQALALVPDEHVAAAGQAAANGRHPVRRRAGFRRRLQRSDAERTGDAHGSE